MITTLHSLTAALPHIAAEIDVTRPMLSPMFANALIGVNMDEENKVIWLHCKDEPTHNFLSIPTQLDGVKAAFVKHNFADYQVSIHPVTWSDAKAPELPLAQPATTNSEPGTPPKKRTANTLNFLERQALQKWMEKPDNAHLVAHESDTHAASEATRYFSQLTKPATTEGGNNEPAFPDLIITAGNIASMRRLLRIEKIKPEKHAPVLPEGTTLADLQKQLEALQKQVHTMQCDHRAAMDATQQNQLDHIRQIDALRASGTGADATIASLHRVLSTVVKYLNGRFHGDNETCAVPELPPLRQSGQSGQ